MKVLMINGSPDGKGCRLIGYAPSLRPINEMMIEPMIYCMYLGKR